MTVWGISNTPLSMISAMPSSMETLAYRTVDASSSKPSETTSKNSESQAVESSWKWTNHSRYFSLNPDHEKDQANRLALQNPQKHSLYQGNVQFFHLSVELHRRADQNRLRHSRTDKKSFERRRIRHLQGYFLGQDLNVRSCLLQSLVQASPWTLLQSYLDLRKVNHH